MTKPKPCKWCTAGYEVRDGQHWIVKSIYPARVSIKDCAAIARSRSRSVTVNNWQRIAQLSAETVRDSCATLLGGTIDQARQRGLEAVPIPALLFILEAIKSLKMPNDVVGDDQRELSKSAPSVSLTQARGASSKKPSPPQTC